MGCLAPRGSISPPAEESPSCGRELSRHQRPGPLPAMHRAFGTPVLTPHLEPKLFNRSHTHAQSVWLRNAILRKGCSSPIDSFHGQATQL